MGLTATFFFTPSTSKWQPSSGLLLRSRPKRSAASRSVVPMARLFGPAIFEASKLKVLFLGVDEKKHPTKLPRTYTLTHSDVTSRITLAVSNSINKDQLGGWYNRLQRDEVVAEWRKVKGKMSLHVHCHVSGGHFLLDFIANLRYYIFSKELPVVLKAFVHGDWNLFNDHPELAEAPVWVYFHSNLPEFDRIECWGPLGDAVTVGRPDVMAAEPSSSSLWPQRCEAECDCCFPHRSLVPLRPHRDPHGKPAGRPGRRNGKTDSHRRLDRGKSFRAVSQTGFRNHVAGAISKSQLQ